MDLGVGLPSTIPSATGSDVLSWATEADASGFSSLGTIDRVVYGNHETIPTMAAAAASLSGILAKRSRMSSNGERTATRGSWASSPAWRAGSEAAIESPQDQAKQAEPRRPSAPDQMGPAMPATACAVMTNAVRTPI